MDRRSLATVGLKLARIVSRMGAGVRAMSLQTDVTRTAAVASSVLKLP
jgi:hypothetical protein